jgi:hypothetical protein
MVVLVVAHLQVVLLVIDFIPQLDQVGMVEVQEEENQWRLDAMVVPVVMDMVEELPHLHSLILQKEVLAEVALEEMVVMVEHEVDLPQPMVMDRQFLHQLYLLHMAVQEVLGIDHLLMEIHMAVVVVEDDLHWTLDFQLQ